jgi:hypothetical protein
MVRPDEMPVHIRRMINDLGFGDRSQLDRVVPSLFRHLCDAPGLLAIVHVVLAPKFRDNSLACAVDCLSAAMANEAAGLASFVGPVPLLAATPMAFSTGCN